MNDPKRIEAALARNLREWRTRRDWSQAELAARAGVSKGMLVQIERAQTNPSIATLCKLANALGVALPRLVELSEEPVIRRVPRDEVAWLWKGRARGSAAGLVAGVEFPVPVEVWEWRIGPRDGYDAVAHPPGTREILYVLEGTVRVDVDGVETAVEAGEGVVFRADRPHRYASAGGKATRLLMVVVEPLDAVPTGAERTRSGKTRPARRPRPASRA